MERPIAAMDAQHEALSSHSSSGGSSGSATSSPLRSPHGPCHPDTASSMDEHAASDPAALSASTSLSGGYCEVFVNLLPPSHTPDDGKPSEQQLTGKARFRAAALQVIEHLRASHGKVGPFKAPLDVSEVHLDIRPDDSSEGGNATALVAPQTPSLASRLTKQFVRELMLGGEMVCRWLTPAKLGHHWIVFTPTLLTSMLFVFAFMAAQYPYYLAWHNTQKCNMYNPTVTCFTKAYPTANYGPNFLLEWLSGVDTPATSFSFNFMNEWGARYAPMIVEQPQLWFTSQFIHVSLVHLVGNMAVFAALAIPLERRFGWWRVLVVWVVSVVGGAFFSTAVEDPCTQVVGASGGVFGIVGMFAADLVLNRQYLTMPIYRAVMVVVFLAIFVGTVFTQPDVSHMTHLGGFLCGLLPTFLFLPNERQDRMQRVLPWVGLISLVTWFTVLPIWVYTHTLVDLQC